MQSLFVRTADLLLPIFESMFCLTAAGLILLRGTQHEGRKSKPSGFAAVERWFRDFAQRKSLAVLGVILFVLLGRVTLIPVIGVPQPRWPDEFSYLLAGETFASGQATNPTHPMWIHFESFHIIQQPTYQSMYPPAQGLVLAGGILLGHPWIGVLLITALACGALCWMLQGWLPPSWALFGACIAALRLGFFTYWMNGYWCGSVAMLGGALLLGAYPRLKGHCRIRDAILLSLGVAILANSRPYEGLVLSLPVAMAMVVCLSGRKRPTVRIWMFRLVSPIVALLTLTAAGMGYYFWRATGDPFRMPYEVNRSTYAVAPYFVWQTLRSEPIYHHAAMKDFYTRVERNDFLQTQSISGWLKRSGVKAVKLWRFYLGPVLTIPLVALPCIFRDRRVRFPLSVAFIFCLGLLVETWTDIHYAAPATALLYLLLTQAMRHLWVWRWRGASIGASVARAIPVICVAVIVLRVVAFSLHVQIEPDWPHSGQERAALIRELDAQPGQQFVIVAQFPITDKEYVYNEPNIDHAQVVWARDMGPEKNEELLGYFNARKAWWLDPSEDPVKVVPYEAVTH